MPRRLLPLIAVALATVAWTPGAASAADLYAAPDGGAGPGCTSASAPCSVSAALLAARSSAGADTVRLAVGTYTTPVSATNAADSDVTLAGAGVAATIIAAAPAGDAPMVALGAGAGTMALEDLTLDGTGAGTFASPLRGRLSALTLRRVRVVQTGSTAKQAPAIDADMATEVLTLDAVEVVADTQSADATVSAVNAGGPAIVRDSTITHTATGGSAALYARGPLTLQRSTLVHGDADAGYALRLSNQTDAVAVTIDSSVLRGGRSAARFDLGPAASQLTVRGATFAPAAASTGWSVDVQPAGRRVARAGDRRQLAARRALRTRDQRRDAHVRVLEPHDRRQRHHVSHDDRQRGREHEAHHRRAAARRGPRAARGLARDRLREPCRPGRLRVADRPARPSPREREHERLRRRAGPPRQGRVRALPAQPAGRDRRTGRAGGRCAGHVHSAHVRDGAGAALGLRRRRRRRHRCDDGARVHRAPVHGHAHGARPALGLLGVGDAHRRRGTRRPSRSRPRPRSGRWHGRADPRPDRAGRAQAAP